MSLDTSVTDVHTRLCDAVRSVLEATKQVGALANVVGGMERDNAFRYRNSNHEEIIKEVSDAQVLIAECCDKLLRASNMAERGMSASSIGGLSCSSSEQPMSSKTSFFYDCEGNAVTSLLVNSSSFSGVDVKPDVELQSVHSRIRQVFGDKMPHARPGGQALMVPLLTTPQCSLVVEREPAVDGGLKPRSTGFTFAALLGLGTKLLNAMDRGVALKAVFVTRTSKAEEVAALLDLIPRPVQCINLLRPTPQDLSIVESMPRLIACTVDDIIDLNMIRLEDVDHLIVDACDERTAAIFTKGPLKKLQDVVFRGPFAVVRKLPCPKPARYRARLWTFERRVNVYDVQAFTMGKQIEDLFATFPPGRNYLFTTQANAFLHGVTVIPSLDVLPEDVDHLVIADLLFTVSDVRGLLKKACAKNVTIVCSQPGARAALSEAVSQEMSLSEVRSPSTANSTERRSVTMVY